MKAHDTYDRIFLPEEEDLEKNNPLGKMLKNPEDVYLLLLGTSHKLTNDRLKNVNEAFEELSNTPDTNTRKPKDVKAIWIKGDQLQNRNLSAEVLSLLAEENHSKHIRFSRTDISKEELKALISNKTVLTQIADKVALVALSPKSHKVCSARIHEKISGTRIISSTNLAILHALDKDADSTTT